MAALELAREQIPALERAREEKSLLRGGGLHILLQQQASQATKPKAKPIGHALWKRQPIEQSPHTPFAAGQTPYPLEAQPAYDSFNPLQVESPSILRTMRISRPHGIPAIIGTRKLSSKETNCRFQFDGDINSTAGAASLPECSGLIRNRCDRSFAPRAARWWARQQRNATSAARA